ncbi:MULTISPECIES: class I SAM-dependent methyltransferase [unclassified Streptomyces]|uniref:class I SAM-dependent methyltransferase n=1 Tax=unclassified Streptomyces TaxID=2593676 RepID=UPI0003772A22|nr:MULTISPECIES: class I SAM-dependent methyltransferase [unclassified Streptomyces]MYT30287.1 methyltransferase domain-containing protein [Streptomyces sp. SID8354]
MSSDDRPAPGHLPHGGADQDGAAVDWEVLGPLLERGAEIQTPLLEQAAAWLRALLAADGPDAGPAAPGPPLRPVAVRRVLDVGSGPGVVSCLLARAFPDAEVCAVDATEALLDRARARAARLGLADRIHTHCAEVPHGLDALGGADLIWSSKALHHVGDQRGAVAALAAHLRPGGLLAIAEGGLAPRFLPRDIGIGRPGLQARLDAAAEDWFTAMRAALPDATDTLEDWPAFLANAGLRTPLTRSFLLDLPAPLHDDARRYLQAHLTRAVEHYADQLDADDVSTLTRLIDPHDPAGITRRPDVFLLSAQTVHTARAPEQP